MAPRSSSRIASLTAERRFELLVDAVTDCAIYMMDPDGSIASWNSGAELITGYRAGEVIGQNYALFFTREDRRVGTPAQLLSQVRAHGRMESEGWRKRKDGSRFWSVAVIEPIRDERGNFIGFANVTRDVTEREAARQALAESERQLRLLVRGVTDYAIYMLDPNGIVSSWNAGAERIKGYRADEIIGRHFSSFYTPADRLAGVPRRALETAASTGRYEAEGLRVRKDGSQFWASVVIDAIRDDNGALIGFAKITRDITERRAAQESLRKAQEQLALHQKMEALSQLTGGIAHDFNNLLMIVGGQTEMLRRRTTAERDQRALDAIGHAVKQGARLTRQMLAFARANPHTRAVVNLAERVTNYRELLKSSAREDIAFEVEIDPAVWPVFVDPGEFDLALINLAVNARDAMSGGGTITLRMYNVGFDSDDEIGMKGEFVAVSVSDTGTGIAPEHLSRVFEPFFTTKDAGKGSGLGLSQVYGFARHSGGTVQVRSEPGRGATFMIFLPRSHETAATGDVGGEAVEPQAAPHGTILIVEDDDRVAEVSAALVQQIGYRTLVVPGAREALDALAREKEIVLVFSDIVMPGSMDGIQLARTVRERHPNTPVLLTSGYARMAEAAAGEFPILRKPYELTALARAVHQAVHSTVASQ
ncbi:MAG TPA: PAS domain S-box protein [Rhizomicrobium sp.]|jgi:PAS domain S-box-containing protein|nr:PAS domain S-box protein [Rhizomicrobium sp.]